MIFLQYFITSMIIALCIMTLIYLTITHPAPFIIAGVCVFAAFLSIKIQKILLRISDG